MRTIALDVSGAATGWAFGEDHSLKAYGKFISDLKKPRGERLYDFSHFLEQLFLTYKPDIILIERPYLGRNSDVLVNLSKFIALVELQAFLVLGLRIEDEWFISSKTVKKIMSIGHLKKPKSQRAKYNANKQQMVNRINALCGLTLQYADGKSKKYNDDDIADAIAVLLTWWKLMNHETTT